MRIPSKIARFDTASRFDTTSGHVCSLAVGNSMKRTAGDCRVLLTWRCNLFCVFSSFCVSPFIDKKNMEFSPTYSCL